jgi:hypothetical protein
MRERAGEQVVDRRMTTHRPNGTVHAVLPLTTSRLTLRMLGVDDAAAFVAYRNDPGVAR